MTNQILRFSETPRPTKEEFNQEKYPLVDYLRLRKERLLLQNRIESIESTRGERNLLPGLRKEASALDQKLADAPPDPIFPPPAKLIKVSGKLEAFNARHIPHYFDPEAFPHTHDYFSRQQERAANAAVVMAATGQGATAQGMLLEGNRITKPAWHVTGQINGRRFSGWLGYTFSQPGEEVELIVAPVGEEYLVYALVKPQERSIAMTPNCYRGKRQGRWMGTRVWLGILIFCLIGVVITWAVVHGISKVLTWDLLELIMTCIISGGVLVIAPALYNIWRHHPFPQEDLAEEIFTLMGWKNVTNINLAKLNRRRKRQWKRTGKPENPYKDQTPFFFSGWARDFYYY